MSNKLDKNSKPTTIPVQHIQPEKLQESQESPVFFESNGFKVLRQLTPDELQNKPADVVITDEGFNMNGINDTTTIEGLKSLNGTSISQLEYEMRPSKLSYSGFLGVDESLLQVLANDNDIVLKMELNHQQIAEFLDYFKKALKVGYKEEGSNKKHAFEYNGRIFIFEIEAWRGSQQSPFNDDLYSNIDCSLVCLDDGSRINYSGLLPEMIRRYGFYEGTKVSYRVDPKSIAEIAGFSPKSEEEPVAKLVQDEESVVEINTIAQLQRISNLAQCGKNLIFAKNCSICPDSFETLVYYLEMLDSNYNLNGLSPSSIRSITSRIVNDNLNPQIFEVSSDMDTNMDTTLIHTVPTYFSQLKPAVLRSIQGIKFNSESSYELKIFLKECLDQLMINNTDESTDHHHEYFSGLLQKVEINSESALIIYKEILYYYESFKSPDERLKFIETIETAMPTLKEQIIVLHKQVRMDVSDNDSLEQLLISYADFIKQYQIYEETISSLVDFARRIGGKSVNKEAMFQLYLALSTENDKSSHIQREAMQKLGLEPELLHYAYIAARGNNSFNPRIEIVINQLFNGAAKKMQDIEKASIELPANIDDAAKHAALEIITGIIKEHFKVSLEEFISQINTKASELQQNTELQDNDELGQLSEIDILNVFLGLRVPPFKNFLTSSFVRKKFTGEFSKLVSVSIDRGAINTIPETVINEGYLSETIRRVEIDGQEFTIEKYKIRTGNLTLRLENDDKVSLYMREG